MAEKTQKPTAKRLQDARRRGEVVKSADVTSAVVFVGVVTSLWMLGPGIFRLTRELWMHATAGEVMSNPGEHLMTLAYHAGIALVWAVVPLSALACVFGMAGAFLQVGGLMAWTRIKPDMKRLNPAAGLKRIFSTNNVIGLAKMILKTLLLSGLMFLVVRASVNTALQAGQGHAIGVLHVAAALLMIICGWAAVIYMLMAALDYIHMHYEHMKQNKMSIDDVRRENKDAEGDPILMGRRRAAQAEAAYAGLIDRVQASSAVIHSSQVAIALQYRGPDDLPRVIARGEGAVAVQIIRVARDALIPTESDVNLAQRLYDDVALDRPIPRYLYERVATLLRWAQGLS